LSTIIDFTKFKDWRNKFTQPSKLDNFAQFLTGRLHEYEDVTGMVPDYTDELFVERLLISIPSINMTVGTKLHSLLEHLRTGDVIEDKFVHDGLMVNIKIDLDLELLPIKEQMITKNIGDIIIRGKLDGMSKTTISDYKFTKNIQLEKYMESFQWKVYLWMTGKNHFVYDLFEVEIIEDNGIVYVNINNYDKLELMRYPYMNNDVEDMYHQYLYTLKVLKPLIIDTAKKHNIILKGLM
jgi:hypothetical protein